MAIQRFLALTEVEMGGISALPENVAWMGRLFSPETDLFPAVLPADSLLVLTDETPFLSGDIGGLCGRLSRAVSELNCCALLLDFQKPKTKEAAALISRLSQELPLILPPAYADGQNFPVFLPPAPLDVPLAEYLAPWKNRDIWLELALDGLEIILTESGARSIYLPHPVPFSGGHREEKLHCHYKIETAPDQIQFTLRRTREDVEDLVSEAERLGVMGCVGLWQELG